MPRFVSSDGDPLALAVESALRTLAQYDHAAAAVLVSAYVDPLPIKEKAAGLNLSPRRYYRLQHAAEAFIAGAIL